MEKVADKEMAHITIWKCLQYCRDNNISIMWGYRPWKRYDSYSYEPWMMWYRPQDKLDKPIEPTVDFEPIIDYLLNI